MKGVPRFIGVIHLPPLAGAPSTTGFDRECDGHEALQRAGERAVREAGLLESAGFEALILENFGDTPFFADHAPPETVASLAVLASAIREATKLPVGINVLRNDARSALAIAAVTGSEFIRVNVLCGVAATDQGLIAGQAATLLRERARLGASVGILADILVKHATTLGTRDPGLAVDEVVGRGGADGVIVTGEATGMPVDFPALERAAQAAGTLGVPLYAGSGVEPENLAQCLEHADGVIVGSWFRQGGRAGQPIDPRRLRAWSRASRAGLRKETLRKGRHARA